jgi:uncharacterized membrane protein
MAIIIATLVIAVSAIIFHFLWSNIIIITFFDIPTTLKLSKVDYLEVNKIGLLKKQIVSVAISTVIVIMILSIMYYLFSKYSFGWTISVLIGIIISLLRSIYLSFYIKRNKENYSNWLNLYLRDNREYLSAIDADTVSKILSK